MSRIVVASKFVWSHYPGLRAGRIYAGKSDITKHPDAETHVIESADAAQTRCGLPRARFPHEFAEGTAPGSRAQLCATCLPDGTP